MIVPVMAISILVLTRQIYSEEANGAHAHYREPVPLTIIPRGRVGYEMIDSQWGALRRVGDNHLKSNKREWNNCFIKNAYKISLNLPD